MNRKKFTSAELSMKFFFMILGPGLGFQSCYLHETSIYFFLLFMFASNVYYISPEAYITCLILNFDSVGLVSIVKGMKLCVKD